MATQWEIGSHEVQVILTLTLLAATSILALLCDYLRFRTLRSAAPANQAPAPLKTAIAPTLVPEIEAPEPAPKSSRASRLAAALKQPRRELSPAVQAIIERSSQHDVSAPAPPKKSESLHKKSKLRRAG